MTGSLSVLLTLGAALAGSAVPPGAPATPAAAALEQQLARRPDDLELRERLLVTYLMDRSPEGRAAHARHALWVIEHAPGSEVAGTPYAEPDRLDPAHERARALWLGHAAKDDAEAAVLANAAVFFGGREMGRAEELLARAVMTEPQNPVWRLQLARLYALENEVGAPDRDAAVAALELYETVLALATDETERYLVLDEVADAAHAVRDADKARAYAQELLALATRLPRDWNHGNAVHEANRVLGHVALERGELAAARAHLLAAGATPGSPQLDSFGPDLSLANALLSAGERAAVVEYLKLCTSFWKHRAADVQSWIAVIEAGGSLQLDRFRGAAAQP